MSFALVGSVGAVSQSGNNASVTPAWGTGESRTSGNLLVLWVSVTNSTTAVGTPSGWSVGVAPTGSNSTTAAIFYKIASGGDAAPTIPGQGAGAIASVQLAEFSGNSAAPLDQSGSNGGAAVTSLTVAASSTDRSTGDLVVVATALLYSTNRTITTTDTGNNGVTLTSVTNNSTSTGSHYDLCYGFPTTSNSVASQDAITGITSANQTGVFSALVTFLSTTPEALAGSATGVMGTQPSLTPAVALQAATQQTGVMTGAIGLLAGVISTGGPLTGITATLNESLVLAILNAFAPPGWALESVSGGQQIIYVVDAAVTAVSFGFSTDASVPTTWYTGILSPSPQAVGPLQALTLTAGQTYSVWAKLTGSATRAEIIPVGQFIAG